MEIRKQKKHPRLPYHFPYGEKTNPDIKNHIDWDL